MRAPVALMGPIGKSRDPTSGIVKLKVPLQVPLKVKVKVKVKVRTWSGHGQVRSGQVRSGQVRL